MYKTYRPPHDRIHQVFENLTDITSYSYDSTKEELVSYDTPHIASLKAQYVSTNNLAGNMFWDVSMALPWVIRFLTLCCLLAVYR